MQIVAIQETKLTAPYQRLNYFRNLFHTARTLNGGGVMLLVHKDIPHMPLAELDNDIESVWSKHFANKTTHFVAI